MGYFPYTMYEHNLGHSLQLSANKSSFGLGLFFISKIMAAMKNFDLHRR